MSILDTVCNVAEFEYLDDERRLWLPLIGQNSTEAELQDMIKVVESDEKQLKIQILRMLGRDWQC